jgi:hypothetical protein
LPINAGEVGQRPAVSPRRPDLVEQLERLLQVSLRLVGLVVVEAASVNGEGIRRRLPAAARFCECLRPID